MKALRTKSGKWLNLFFEGTIFLLSDEPYILREQDDADELRLRAMSDTACDVEIVTGEFLTDADLDTIRREAFEAGRGMADSYTLERGNYVMMPVYPTAQDYIDSLKKEESK